MSKELECLDRIDKRNYLTEREHKEFLGVVEKAIKEYEAIKNAEPTKAMKCLDSMYARLPQWDLCRNLDQYNIIKQALQRLEAIDKAVEICKDAKNKAESFELILFKNVDLNLIRHSASAESYNSKIPYYRVNLTNDEFTFLKEIIRQSLLQRIEAEE